MNADVSDEPIARNADGYIKPQLPARIEKALRLFNAMTEPYFDGDSADKAQRDLRVAIRAALTKAKSAE